MARKQSAILDLNDDSNYWFVIQWISSRFDEEERDPNNYVMSEPVGRALDAYIPTAEVHSQVRASWRIIQKMWVDGWDKDYNNKLSKAEEYFSNLVVITNKWLDEHFPVDETGVGRERKRLLAAVRQRRLREKRKGMSGGGTIQVSISGDLYKLLYCKWDIPESKRHDVVRSALSIVLESQELLERAKLMSNITK